jgi:hypothetical protein
MFIRSTLIMGLVSIGAVSAFAQTPVGNTTQRDVNQQVRIESGLKDGSLTTREASRLESEQAQIDRLQAKDLRDGHLSPQERAQLQRAQNRAGHDIHRDATNRANGNPESKSSERMQADVQRNVNQQTRIAHGLQSGSLTHKEVGQLERGQARDDHREAAAGRDGHVGAREQRAMNRHENQQSEIIHAKKHNDHHAGSYKG